MKTANHKWKPDEEHPEPRARLHPLVLFPKSQALLGFLTVTSWNFCGLPTQNLLRVNYARAKVPKLTEKNPRAGRELVIWLRPLPLLKEGSKMLQPSWGRVQNAALLFSKNY